MRAGWRAARQVRAAEKRLHRDACPSVTLMQRAAAGLARRCAPLLADRNGVYGSQVLLLVGAGNNGGDALFAGALLARAGRGVRALLLNPDRSPRRGSGRAATGRRHGRAVEHARGVHSGHGASTGSSASAPRDRCAERRPMRSRALAALRDRAGRDRWW